jgi:hypothetical protein
MSHVIVFSVLAILLIGAHVLKTLLYYGKSWFHTVQGNHEHNFSHFYGLYGELYRKYDFQNGTEWSREMSDVFLAELKRL